MIFNRNIGCIETILRIIGDQNAEPSTETLDVLKHEIYAIGDKSFYRFNRNIGCIETDRRFQYRISILHFNRNIGCIET